MQKISTCLIFNNQAEEAVHFYTSIFKNSKIISITHAGENEHGAIAGSVRTIAFQMHGLNYIATNGGPHITFNDGVSLMVNCDTQEEIDNLWEKLSADGGEKIQSGWLIDKFGFRWQIVPKVLSEMMSDYEPIKSNRVMQEILHMKKLDIATLKQVYESEK